MNTWNLILTAAALLVFIHGARVSFSAKQESKTAVKRHTLGCSYAILATSIWSVALGSMMGNWWVGVRLAFGLFLLLVAVSAMLRPAGAQLMKAAMGVMIGGLLVGPIAPDVWAQINPSAKDKLLAKMDTRVAELRKQLKDTQRLTKQMQRDQSRLANAVRAKEFKDYTELSADSNAAAKLRELAEVEHLLAKNESQVVAIRAQLQALETALSRLERRIQVEESAGNEVTAAEVESIMRDLELQQLEPSDPVTLDDYAEQEALRRLFERTANKK